MTSILILIAFSLAARFALRGRSAARGWVLLGGSALAVFYLQPVTPVRYLDFWLPLATLALAALTWAATLPPGQVPGGRENWVAAGVAGGVVLLAGLTRYVLPDPLLTASRPPQILAVLAALLLAAALALGMYSLAKRGLKWLAGAVIVLLLALFVTIKVPGLAALAAAGLRALAGQSTTLATAADLRWLGFSYLAFRLMHTARDRQSGRLPAVSLREYLTYAIFFPALSAGPIDRLERFIKDLRAPFQPDSAGLLAAGVRLAAGLFKKFVLADMLALVALNATNAAQVISPGWAWLLVYAYAFQIFFDFSGYTDIAIGTGMLLGIKLPENFNAPYLKPNLTQFWNNWHMTLTQWFRAYTFNPLTRWLRTRPRQLSVAAIILFTQVITMVLIGLWHGVTWNFILWGLWHGLGLFAQNRYSEWARAHLPALTGWRAAALNIVNVLATFHFVALGWVFFALPQVGLSLRVLGVLLPW